MRSCGRDMFEQSHDTLFSDAVAALLSPEFRRHVIPRLSAQERLELWSLHKQATTGDASSGASQFTETSRLRRKAWKAFDGLPHAQAKFLFVDRLCCHLRSFPDVEPFVLHKFPAASFRVVRRSIVERAARGGITLFAATQCGCGVAIEWLLLLLEVPHQVCLASDLINTDPRLQIGRINLVGTTAILIDVVERFVAAENWLPSQVLARGKVIALLDSIQNQVLPIWRQLVASPIDSRKGEFVRFLEMYVKGALGGGAFLGPAAAPSIADLWLTALVRSASSLIMPLRVKRIAAAYLGRVSELPFYPPRCGGNRAKL
jgi:acyl-CoA-binding protein